MNHFFIDPGLVTDDKVYIRGMDVKHIRNVLRMKPGEELLASDGEGHDYSCRICTINDDEIECKIISESLSLNESPVRFHLFQGLPKADKFEHIIQKSVELGVYEIVPVITARSIVKYDEKKQQTKGQRWLKISESAAKQSRRGIIPQVHEIMKFDDAVKYASGMDMVFIPYENYKDMQQTKAALAKIAPGMDVGIFVGPEGGFEQTEVEKACTRKSEGGADAVQISLGSRILRTETAPLMLLSVLMFQMEN